MSFAVVFVLVLYFFVVVAWPSFESILKMVLDPRASYVDILSTCHFSSARWTGWTAVFSLKNGGVHVSRRIPRLSTMHMIFYIQLSSLLVAILPQDLRRTCTSTSALRCVFPIRPMRLYPGQPHHVSEISGVLQISEP